MRTGPGSTVMVAEFPGLRRVWHDEVLNTSAQSEVAVPGSEPTSPG